jgi:hypothetical protein
VSRQWGALDDAAAAAKRAANVIEVEKEADWGPAIGDTITLEAVGIYRIIDAHTLTKGLVIPAGANVEIQCVGQNINTVTFTCPTQPFLSSTGVSFLRLDGFTVNFVSASQQLFDLTGDGTGPLQTSNFTAIGIANSGMGGISGFLTVTMFEVAMVGAPTWAGELLFSDVDMAITSSGFFNSVSSGGALIAAESTTPHVFEFLTMRVLPQAGESAFRISSATQDAASRVVIGDVNSGAPQGNLFDPSGLDETDPRVLSRGNFGRASSTLAGEGIFTGNISNTVIPAPSAWVLHASANLWVFEEENRTIGALNGIVEVTSLEPLCILVDGSIRLNPTGGNKLCGAAYVQVGTEAIAVTFDAAADTFTAAGLSNGDAVVLLNSPGTIPGGLTQTEVYYVVNTNQLSYTPGGVAIDITSNGSANTFDRATLHGSRESEEIGSSVPRNVVVQGLMCANPGDKVGIYIRNTTDTTNILAAGGYTRTAQS